MIENFQKSFSDLSKLAIDGKWEINDDTMEFQGSEFDLIQSEPNPLGHVPSPENKAKQKIAAAGTVIFGQNFRDGRIQAQVEFDEVDHRSAAGIVIQHNSQTRDMLTFTISGRSIPYDPGVSGFQFRLQSWRARPDQLRQ